MGSDSINIDGKRITVPNTPISSWTTLSTPLRPRVRVTGDRLTLEVDRGVGLLGLVFIVWGLGFAALGVLAIIYKWPMEVVLVGLLPGTVCPLVGLLMVSIQRQCVFDRQEGIYQKRSLVDADVRPLSNIVGVQTIRGHVAENTSDDGGTWRQQTYQMNLIVTGGSGRIGVICTVDDNWVVEASQAVSQFIGVPIVGKLYAEPDAAADGGAR
jgi:hypothetical protein